MFDSVISNSQGHPGTVDRIELGGSGFLAAQRLNKFKAATEASIQSGMSWERKAIRRDDNAPVVRFERGRPTLQAAKWGIPNRERDGKYVQASTGGRRGLIPVLSYVVRMTPKPEVHWEYTDYMVSRIDDDWFWMAVSWDWQGSPTSGDVRFAIMTVAADDDLKSHFTRTPMAVPPQVWEHCADMTSPFSFPAPAGTWKVGRL